MALWAQGRLFLITWPSSKYFIQWRQLLDHHNVNLVTYTRNFFQTMNGVYLVISPKHAQAYVGATSISITGRYRTRIRKWRQIRNCRFVECEVAIRFWHKTNTFFHYIPILACTTDNKETTFVMEAVIQQQYQPSLCMPWIATHVKN